MGLEIENARKEFGGLMAVNDISFNVRGGQILGLIGPKGSRKSTMFNLVTGVFPLTSVTIRFRAQLDLQQISVR